MPRGLAGNALELGWQCLGTLLPCLGALLQNTTSPSFRPDACLPAGITVVVLEGSVQRLPFNSQTARLGALKQKHGCRPADVQRRAPIHSGLAKHQFAGGDAAASALSALEMPGTTAGTGTAIFSSVDGFLAARWHGGLATRQPPAACNRVQGSFPRTVDL
eukprot:354852-Chlamydomonas_euryale.AAC.3